MTILFISCQSLSGLQQLIDPLLKSTGYQCLTREDLIKEVSQNGKWAAQLLTQFSRTTYSYENISRLRRPYIVLMRQALLEKIQAGSVIYCGSSGHLLVPRLEHFIRVRISAPFNQWVALTMERLKCDEKAAREYISTSNDAQVRWAHFVFGLDIRDPDIYDINISIDHLTIPVVSDILKHLLRKNDTQIAEEQKNQVERALLAAKVEAALVIDPRTRELEIGARMDNGSVHLTGPYLEDTTLAVAQEIAKKVDGAGNILYNPDPTFMNCLEEHEGNLMLKY